MMSISDRAACSATMALSADIRRRRRVDAKETRRRDADDVERLAVEIDRPADDTWVAAERALPEGIAHDCRRCARRVVVRSEGSPEHGAHAKRVEVVAGD